MDKIDVSVIVPVYNSEEYIGATLDSIINQDFRNFELIVIDDGSTDKSLEVINQKLSNATISYNVIHQENSGVSGARNRGIDAANGEFLVFIDADDYVTGNHLSELYNAQTDFSMVQFIKKENDKFARISVRDFGCGISEDDQAKLFHTATHFSKYGTNNEEGSGLGLLLCQDFAIKNGGNVYLESVLGEGSTFSFTVPLVGEEQEKVKNEE